MSEGANNDSELCGRHGRRTLSGCGKEFSRVQILPLHRRGNHLAADWQGDFHWVSNQLIKTDSVNDQIKKKVKTNLVSLELEKVR